ncbi:agamous-like MADS-box protein AGL62 [Sesamum indicum]|uniref:Agamous-like MADS-box protein AGL62 n=1 Tax=Sesamum indicum TaxID=4182 RepID=A0A6I9TTB4_SESIN|nr:agamous-like MADS-box protein AGL62 [Sesamum indicum]
MARKSSRGRQKIEMTRMSKESNLLVTFSKRRSGLFKKASELCILCGAEIAIVVFSPGKKVFSFGHPSVESVVERYLAPSTPPVAAAPPVTTTAVQLVEAHRSASVRELNVQLHDVLGRLDAERRRGVELSRLRKEGPSGGRWWEAPIKDLSMEELVQLKEAMEDLSKNVSQQAENLMVVEAAAMAAVEPSPFSPPPGFGGGDGSSVVEDRVPGDGLGQLSVTPQGFTLEFDRSFF